MGAKLKKTKRKQKNKKMQKGGWGDVSSEIISLLASDIIQFTPTTYVVTNEDNVTQYLNSIDGRTLLQLISEDERYSIKCDSIFDNK